MTQLLQENIIRLFGISSASSPVKSQILSRLVDLVEKRVMVIILDRLSTAEQEQFFAILENGTDEERTVFLQTHVPDVGKVIDQEVIRVKQQAQQFAAQYAGAAA